MPPVDVAVVHVSVELLRAGVVPREPLRVVRDVEPAIRAALERTEHARPRGRARQTHVQEALERARIAVRLNVILLSIRLLLPRVSVIEAELLQHATSAQKPRAVSGRVVGEASLHPVAHKLLRVSRRDADVTADSRVEDLARDKAVANAHAEAVLRRTKLVLVLERQPQASTVVRLANPPALRLHLEALEVVLRQKVTGVRHSFPRK
mmetsp:Transcript_4700/g.16224  ORF Transcript_4700/g.16224 Transcript_4700/m.16224 type:complete len:208 (+) Transcript_4700:1957-2580(+)